MREVYLIYFLSMSSAEGTGQGGGHGQKQPFAVEVSAKLVSKQWDHSVRGQRQVKQGAPSGCLGWRPRVISYVRGYASCMVTEGNGKFGSFWDIFSAHHGGSLLWNALARNDLTQPDCIDLHSIRSKNLHELTGAGDDRWCFTDRTQAAVAWKIRYQMNLWMSPN